MSSNSQSNHLFTCQLGFEPLLSGELQQHGFQPLDSGSGWVYAAGTGPVELCFAQLHMNDVAVFDVPAQETPKEAVVKNSVSREDKIAAATLVLSVTCKSIVEIKAAYMDFLEFLR